MFIYMYRLGVNRGAVLWLELLRLFPNFKLGSPKMEYLFKYQNKNKKKEAWWLKLGMFSFSEGLPLWGRKVFKSTLFQHIFKTPKCGFTQKLVHPSHLREQGQFSNLIFCCLPVNDELTWVFWMSMTLGYQFYYPATWKYLGNCSRQVWWWKSADRTENAINQGLTQDERNPGLAWKI